MHLGAEFQRICDEAARAGGRKLLDFAGRAQVREKGPSDLVTEADWASQEAIRQVLLGTFPHHGLISEELDQPVNPEAELCWIVDPLDGTTNYVHQIPHYAVSIALLERGSPITATILDPVHDELFSASKSGGAWLNGSPIHTSAAADPAESIVAASFSARVSADSPEIEQFRSVLLNCQAVRRTGSAALNMAYLAAGRFDAFWSMSTKAWDVAAGVLLVQEAGGVIRHVSGTPFDLSAPHPLATATVELQLHFERLLQEATAGRE
ncbi:MAG TPA: inositol monophosphatase family protein [Pirellulales bacterium]|jgi:myo-inositol-1(or 4)-monophosphatase